MNLKKQNLNHCYISRKNTSIMSGKIDKIQTCDGISFRKLISRTSSQYAEQTTIHGFWYLAQSSHGLEKLLWLTVVSIAVFFSVFQTCSLYSQWQKSPVITTLESIALPIKNIEFPVVMTPQSEQQWTKSSRLSGFYSPFAHKRFK